MLVQVHTDNNIHGGERLNKMVHDSVEASLGRFGTQITRVEVHLSDENSHKDKGDDKKCVMEARPAGLKPVAVTNLAPSVEEAVHGAAEKLERLLDSTFHKLHDPKGRTPFGGDT